MGTFPRVTHPSATDLAMPVRLACVKPAASVRSEPGSNSHVQEFNRDPRHRIDRNSTSHPAFPPNDVSSQKNGTNVVRLSTPQSPKREDRARTPPPTLLFISLYIVKERPPPEGERSQGNGILSRPRSGKSARQFRGSVWRRPRERRRRWASYRPARFRVSTRPVNFLRQPAKLRPSRERRKRPAARRPPPHCRHTASRSSACGEACRGRRAGAPIEAAQARSSNGTPRLPVSQLRPSAMAMSKNAPTTTAGPPAATASRGRGRPSASISGTSRRSTPAATNAADVDRRGVNLRWLGASVLTGITGGALIGASIYIALEGATIVAQPPERAVLARGDGPPATTRASTVARKGDKLNRSEMIASAKQGFRAPDDDPRRRPRGHQGPPVRPHRHEPFHDRRHLRDRHPEIQPAPALRRGERRALRRAGARRSPTPTSRSSSATSPLVAVDGERAQPCRTTTSPPSSKRSAARRRRPGAAPPCRSRPS